MRAETQGFTEFAEAVNASSYVNATYKIASYGCQGQGNGASISSFHEFRRPILRKFY